MSEGRIIIKLDIPSKIETFELPLVDIPRGKRWVYKESWLLSKNSSEWWWETDLEK